MTTIIFTLHEPTKAELHDKTCSDYIKKNLSHYGCTQDIFLLQI